MHSRRTLRMKETGVTPGATQQSYSSSRRATLSFTCTTTVCRLPSFGIVRRQTDNLQIWSRNPRPSRGSDPILLTSHLNGPCHMICVEDGSGCVTDSSSAENFYVATQHHCTVLLNKDTFKRDISCIPFQVHCSRELPDMGCVRRGVLWQIPPPTRQAKAQGLCKVSSFCGAMRPLFSLLLLFPCASSCVVGGKVFRRRNCRFSMLEAEL